MDKAITAIVKQAARFDDDQIAREYIVSFDITDALSDKTIDALVAARHDFSDVAEEPDPFAVSEDGIPVDPARFVNAFAAEFAAKRLKKKR